MKKSLGRHALSAAAAGFLLMAGALGLQAQETLVDSLGRRVAVPPRADRIISLDPEATRIIVALGAGDRLVGIDYFLRHHDHIFRIIFPACADLPIVSNGGQDLNMELAVALRPDMVFVSPSEARSPEDISARLKAPVAALASAGSFDVLLAKIGFLGRMLGRRERAEELTSFFSSMADDIRKRTAGLTEAEKPRVYLSFWGALEKTPVRYDPVDWAGGVNLGSSLPASGLGSAGTVVQLEKIMVWDPDIILVQGNYPPSERKVSVESVLGDRRLKLLGAVRRGNVHYTFGYWYWWDPALVLVETLYLGRLFHPGLFQGTGLRLSAGAVFEKFYGRKDLFDNLSSVLKCDEWFEGI